MGKDFIGVSQNNLSLKKAYGLLSGKRIKEASTIELFNLSSLASVRFSEVRDIEIGTSGTKESIIRLDNNNFVVVGGTIGDVNQLRT